MKFCSYPSGHPTCLQYPARWWVVVGNGGPSYPCYTDYIHYHGPPIRQKVSCFFLWLESETQWASRGVSKEQYIHAGPLSTQVYLLSAKPHTRCLSWCIPKHKKMPYPTARWENPPNLISLLMVYSAWGLESVRCSKSGTTGWRYLPAAKLESSPAKVSSENFQMMCGVCSRWVLLSGLMTPFETTNGMEWHKPLIAAANLFATF